LAKNKSSRKNGISNSLKRLEDVKDDIISYYYSLTDLDEHSRNSWIGDINETYFNLVAATDLFRGRGKSTAKAKKERLNNARFCIESAKSKFAQALSELKARTDEKARHLQSTFSKAFDESKKLVMDELKLHDSQKPSTEKTRPENSHPVRKISNTEFDLHCSVCGDVAAKISKEDFYGRTELVYKGITKRVSLDRYSPEAIIVLLKNKNISKLHKHVKERKAMEDGLDVYCPTCNKIYCSKHYDTREEWDAGFYDCTYGTCPEGHLRVIDD